MFRYKCIISYDGTNYMGFQIQEDLPTVELEIKKAFLKMLNLDIKIYSSGRTDRYVHAINQVIHFDLEKQIPTSGLEKGLNTFLPSDIFIKSIEKVSEDFHARFSAIAKEYRYYINVKEYNPLTINYAPNITYLDLDLMKSAISLLVGTHDFKGFASASIDPRKDTIKTIYEAKINVRGDYLEFVFIGNGFLKHQIRRMMGALIDIGRGIYSNDLIIQVLDKKDPKISHRVAPGCGLYLYNVRY
ncbi:MAG: tRNA pseudouridine(38-40) synthase TruA [Anaeroplasma sp.]